MYADTQKFSFADDIDFLAESPRQLDELTARINDESKRYGLIMNAQKTEIMTMFVTRQRLVTLDGDELEQVTVFIYLGIDKRKLQMYRYKRYKT